jgi:hypothetical protein
LAREIEEEKEHVMSKKRKYPYPVPEFMAYLEAAHEETREDAEEYLVLARLLELCHATIEHANAGWQAGQYRGEETPELVYKAIQYGFRRLVPLLLANVVGGWHELLMYVEQPAHYAWYDQLVDWPCARPLKEYHPDEDDAEDESANTEQQIYAQA